MSYRRFNEHTTLTAARESVEFTVEAIDAYPDPAIKKLVIPLQKGLERLDAHEVSRRKRRRAVIRGHALVRTWDGVSDDLVRDLGKDVLGAVRQDRESPLYLRFFPSSPSTVVDLSLDPQVEAMEGLSAALAHTETPDALQKAYGKRLTSTQEAARGALAQRKEALRAVAEGEGEITRAIELIERTRRTTFGALTTYAAENGLGADFPQRFFPTPVRRRNETAGETPTNE